MCPAQSLKSAKTAKSAPSKVQILDPIFTESSDGRSRVYFCEQCDPSKCYLSGTHKRGLGPKSNRRGGQRPHQLQPISAAAVQARKVKKIRQDILTKPKSPSIQPYRFKAPAPAHSVKHADLIAEAISARQAAQPKPTISKSDPRLVKAARQQQIAKFEAWKQRKAAKAARQLIPLIQHQRLYTQKQLKHLQRIKAEIEQQYRSQQKRKQLDLFYKFQLHIICFDNPDLGQQVIKAQRNKGKHVASTYKDLLAAFDIWSQFDHLDKFCLRWYPVSWARECFGIHC